MLLSHGFVTRGESARRSFQFAFKLSPSPLSPPNNFLGGGARGLHLCWGQGSAVVINDVSCCLGGQGVVQHHNEREVDHFGGLKIIVDNCVELLELGRENKSWVRDGIRDIL